jgi:hypothetical protein
MATYICLSNHSLYVPGCYHCNLRMRDPRYAQLWDKQYAEKTGPWALPGAEDPPTVFPSENIEEIRELDQELAAEPGLFGKSLNFRRSYARWKKAVKPMTPPEVRARRLAECQQCERMDKERSVCTVCGCPLEHAGMFVSLLTGAPAKLDMATEECPHPKGPRWRAVVEETVS